MLYDTVYYPQFWYSRFLGSSLTEFDGALHRNAVQLHRAHLRLLALVFRRIYIPRTHLLTQAFSFQADIAAEVFASEEFSYLADAGVIRISTVPGLAPSEDAERITARRAETTKVIYADEPDYLARIPPTERYTVPSPLEAQRNKLEFPRYARTLEMVDPGLSRTVMEHINRSHLKDVPFFHEAFIRELKQILTPEQFDRIWRDTNSLYLTSPAPTEPGIVAYFDESMESPSFRYTADGYDRYLLGPSAIHTFMTMFLQDGEQQALSYAPITQSHRFLRQKGHTSVMAAGFRTEYFNLVRKISRSTRNWMPRNEFRLGIVRNLFEVALDPGLKGRLGLAATAAEDLREFASAGDIASLGLIGGLVKPIVQQGAALVERAARAAQIPNTMEFMSLLKQDLKEKA
ncbi:MAG: hypothetical protein ACK4S3_07415 [Parvibaculum sp.]